MGCRRVYLVTHLGLGLQLFWLLIGFASTPRSVLLPAGMLGMCNLITWCLCWVLCIMYIEGILYAF